MLWAASVEHGFTSPSWMTFKQALDLNAHIRKGEKGSLVVYANTFIRTEEDAGGQEIEREIPFLKGYTLW
jgi:antirestriction protein ArdC